MFDSFKKVAEERMKRKMQRKEQEKARKQGNMLDSSKYENSMKLREKLTTKIDEDDEDEEDS
jgi:hypothetical protein